MLQIHPVPAFSENYIWLLYGDDRQAFVVDPGDASPVVAALAERRLALAGILVTHHHADHTGGIKDLKALFGDMPVYGPVDCPAGGIDHPLRDGDTLSLLGRPAHIIGVPGHTLDHIAYFLPASAQNAAPILFCGDTLFAGGCGRVFEGTHPMMFASLSRLAGLPADTRVCCAHEYTLSNLRFARVVEPANASLEAREQRDKARRERGEPTVPSTIGLELATNPFLRCGAAEVRAAAAAHCASELRSGAAVFAVVRDWKDGFRG